MGFFSQIEGPIRQVLNQLFADPDLKKTVTYKLFQSQSAFDESSGIKESVFSSIALDVIRLRHTQRSQLIGVFNIQLGDELYLINGPDVPSGMSLKDEIVNENGVTQNIKAINDIFGLATAVTIEGGSS